MDEAPVGKLPVLILEIKSDLILYMCQQSERSIEFIVLMCFNDSQPITSTSRLKIAQD